MKITSKNRSRLIWFTVGFFLMVFIGISTFLIVEQEISRGGLLFLFPFPLGLGLGWAWIGPKAGQFFKASMAERRARKQSFTQLIVYNAKGPSMMSKTKKNKSRLIGFTVASFLMIFMGISASLIVKQEITRGILLALIPCTLGAGLAWALAWPKAEQVFKAGIEERRARKQNRKQ